MYTVKLIVFLSSLLLLTSESEAKKRCKPLLEKLHNIQAMQRNGYSSQRGISLRAREDKARDKWWQCERGIREKNKSKKKRKKRKNSQDSANHKSNRQKKLSAGTPFKTNNVIVVKSKYQGAKKQAWLHFYQQPAKCSRPKNLAVFAFCSEDKQAQRISFEREYK